jgi:hypothetical protein
MERMSQAFLQRPTLLAKCGDRVFWSGWTALKRAQDAHVPWEELIPLARNVRQIAASGPSPISRSWTGRIMTLFGPRIALTIR